MDDDNILRQNLLRLRSPISDKDDLLQILTRSLRILGVRYDPATSSSYEPPNIKFLSRYIPEYQLILLENLVPHWVDRFQQSGDLSLLTDYFVPSPTSRQKRPGDTPRMEIIISAYSILTTNYISQFSVDVLSKLTREVPPLDCFRYLLETTDSVSSINTSERWGDYVKAMLSVPGKVANAVALSHAAMPAELEIGYATAYHCRGRYLPLQKLSLYGMPIMEVAYMSCLLQAGRR